MRGREEVLGLRLSKYAPEDLEVEVSNTWTLLIYNRYEGRQTSLPSILGSLERNVKI